MVRSRSRPSLATRCSSLRTKSTPRRTRGAFSTLICRLRPGGSVTQCELGLTVGATLRDAQASLAFKFAPERVFGLCDRIIGREHFLEECAARVAFVDFRLQGPREGARLDFAKRLAHRLGHQFARDGDA